MRQFPVGPICEQFVETSNLKSCKPITYFLRDLDYRVYNQFFGGRRKKKTNVYEAFKSRENREFGVIVCGYGGDPRAHPRESGCDATCP